MAFPKVLGSDSCSAGFLDGDYRLDKVRPLWEIVRHRTLTWWDMEEVFGGLLHQALEIVSHLECEISKLRPSGDALFSQEAVLTLEQRQAVANKLEFVGEDLFRFGLPVSGQTVGDTHTWVRLFQGSVSREDALSRLRELQRTIEREMHSVLFLLIRPEYKKWYMEPAKGWEDAVARWPKITINVDEMSRCFACERYAGAIFHALLIAEFGLIGVCDLFRCSGDKPGWGCLERLQRIRDKSPKDRTDLELKHFNLLEDTIPLLQAVKDSWRHKITHVDNRLVWSDTDFSDHVAEEIIFATRGLMRRLAHDLPSSP